MIRRLILNLLSDMLLLALAADLLYLYYAGAWYDPVLETEIAELVLLYIIACFAVLRAIFHVKEVKDD